MQCDFLITNNGPDRRLSVIFSGESRSRLIDDAGSVHLSRSYGSYLGSDQRSGVTALSDDLVSGVPIRARLRFEGGVEEALVASVVELSASASASASASQGSRRLPGFAGSNFRVQFRDVPLTR